MLRVFVALAWEASSHLVRSELNEDPFAALGKQPSFLLWPVAMRKEGCVRDLRTSLMFLHIFTYTHTQTPCTHIHSPFCLLQDSVRESEHIFQALCLFCSFRLGTTCLVGQQYFLGRDTQRFHCSVPDREISLVFP